MTASVSVRTCHVEKNTLRKLLSLLRAGARHSAWPLYGPSFDPLPRSALPLVSVTLSPSDTVSLTISHHTPGAYFQLIRSRISTHLDLSPDGTTIHAPRARSRKNLRVPERYAPAAHSLPPQAHTQPARATPRTSHEAATSSEQARHPPYDYYTTTTYVHEAAHTRLMGGGIQS